jgi:hypothetical protein
MAGWEQSENVREMVKGNGPAEESKPMLSQQQQLGLLAQQLVQVVAWLVTQLNINCRS